MKCQYCGTEAENRFICPACGKRTDLRRIPMCGATVYNEQAKILDEPNIFMILLAFFMPAFGIFYYFFKISTYKAKARAYFIAGLAGLGTTLLISLAFVLSMLI